MLFTMKIQTAFVLLAAVTSAASAASTGCSSSTETSKIGTTRASLHRAKGCGDLLTDLKSDAAYKLNKGIDRQIEQIQKCIARSKDDANCIYSGGGGSFGAPTVGGMEADASSGAPKGAAPTAPNDRASAHSETNTQVAGVDEADFVKTDGKNIYLIHGRAFKVVKAWPAADLAVLSSLDIEGQPSEMFVDNGKVVIYSQVNGASVYKAAGVTPKAAYNDYNVAYSNSRGGGDSAKPVPVPGSGSGNPPEAYVPLTKVTVLTLDGTTPSVAREMYFEGGYLDSRRVGTHVRTILSGGAHGPLLKYGVYDLYPQSPSSDPQANPYPKTGTEMIAALEKLRAANQASIDASQLQDWLPYTFTKAGSQVQASSIACEDFYVPSTGSTESGLTEVASFDLANPGAPPRETAILGHAETVYGSADTIYLAAHAWVELPFTWNESSGDNTASAGTASPPPQTDAPPPAPATPSPGGARPQNGPATPPPVVTAWAQNKTHIHKFEFASDPTFANYVASGTVVGSVKDQFSLDDRDGYLRIATTERRTYVDETGKWAAPQQDRPSTVNHVFVLGAAGPWLDTVGDVGEIGQNEQIYSVRFVEGRGYVVTFRQVDPLFVFDLTDPRAPRKLAELKIPGFSEYMHPLDATHILTIGRDGTDSGQVRGLQLQIFDVADGAHPVRTHAYTYSGEQYGQSEAEHDHKAFTYFKERKMLAFPYHAYDGTGGGMRSSLELFNVDAATGFAPLGSIDQTELVSKHPAGYCGGYYAPSVRRGIFLDNFVYAISYGGVIAKDAANLSAPGTKLALPAPELNAGYGPACDAGL